MRFLTQLDAGHDKIVQENRQYMRAVGEWLRLLNRLVRWDDSRTAHPSASLLGKFDSTVSKKLSSGPNNVKYLHHDIQKELVLWPAW